MLKSVYSVKNWELSYHFRRIKLMQVVIELPDELGKQLLELPNMEMVVQEVIKKMLFQCWNIFIV
jgi:hypothetical protein